MEKELYYLLEQGYRAEALKMLRCYFQTDLMTADRILRKIEDGPHTRNLHKQECN